MPAGIWPHNPLLPRQGNGHTRHTLLIQSLARPWFSIGYHYPSCPHNANLHGSFPASLCWWSRNESSCQPHHHWLARGHQEVPHPLRPYWQHRETLNVEDGLVLWGEALIIPPAKRERVLYQLHQFHQGITMSQLLTYGSFFWSSINKAIKEVVCQGETCSQFQSQKAAVPLTPTPTPSHPWQMCATDIFMLEWVDHLVVGDFYSKMIFIWCIPPGQSNANKVVLLLKEMFAEHGIPEVLHSDNGPQYESAQFTKFCISWGITYETSGLHYPQSNGFAKACIKSIKHALQQAKYSGANPHLALLALRTIPIDTKLPSPAELLYQCWLRTTIPAMICNSDPSAIHVHEQIDTCSKAAKIQADKCSKTLTPLYAGQPVAMYDTLWNIWVPATVICILPWSSYQVHTSNGSTYHHTWRHLHECSVKAVDTVPSGTTATLQALTRHHLLAVQPALPQPAEHMQPTPAAPATPATQMSQAPAVPAIPAVQKNALAPMSVTSHATPVQPWRSGHACMAPRCLIQEICELSIWTVHRPCYHNAPLSTSPAIHRVKSSCIIFSERGMLYDHFISFSFKDWSLNQLTSVSQNVYIYIYIFPRLNTCRLGLIQLGLRRYVPVFHNK